MSVSWTLKKDFRMALQQPVKRLIFNVIAPVSISFKMDISYQNRKKIF